MPAAVFVIIPIGAAAVIGGLGQLVAKQGATGRADDGADNPVAVAGHHVAKHAAHACTGYGRDHPGAALAVTAGFGLLLIARLGAGRNRDH